MRIGPYRFAPPLWSWIVLVSVVAGTLLLARWQWNKAEYKAAQLAMLDRQAAQPPKPLATWAAGVQPPAYQRIALQGEWSTAGAIWLDNRTRDGIAGFELVMPFRVVASGAVRWVLVDRGWVAREARDTIAPDKLGGMASLVAEVEAPPRRIIELSDQVIEGRVWQNVTPDRYRQHMKVPVEPYLTRMIGGPADGLSRSWPTPDLGRDRNLGYAFQWVAISIAAIVTFFVLTLRKPA